MVTRAITRAQKKVEAYNFEIRKNLLEYDEVMDIQRKEVYGIRQGILMEDRERQKAVVRDFVEAVVEAHAADLLDGAGEADGPPEGKGTEALARWFRHHFGVDCDATRVVADAAVSVPYLVSVALAAWERREREEGEETMRLIERILLLNSIDAKWKDHLHAMDGLKTGIGLRSYGQLDPKVEYKVEGHRMFGEMLTSVREEVTGLLLKVRFSREAERRLGARWEGARPEATPDGPEGPGAGPAISGPAAMPGRDGAPIGSSPGPRKPIRREAPKVGRNDACPCGSGRKFKKCHGAAAS
jgi:preprotein translocase subunit SecA